jgi:hypothetical protein
MDDMNDTISGVLFALMAVGVALVIAVASYSAGERDAANDCTFLTREQFTQKYGTGE